MKKLSIILVLTLAMLALAFTFAGASSMSSSANQMDMGTATPMPVDASGVMDPMTTASTTTQMVTLPDAYASLVNPVAADSASIVRGQSLYATNCAGCHGTSGLGDGPIGASLVPPPAAIAYTSQMLPDNYLFYRISEGGANAPFHSSMPNWSNLSENNRWDLINYIRALSANPASYSTSGSSVGACTGIGAATNPNCLLNTAAYTNTTMTSTTAGSCPMMGGSGMAGMGGMSGMGSMSSMSGQSGMSGNTGMAGMTGTNNMSGMTNMNGTTMNTSTSPMLAETFTPWYSNPWILLGWVTLALTLIVVLIGTVFGIRWLANNRKKVEVVVTPPQP